jgi:hypothetical protein
LFIDGYAHSEIIDTDTEDLFTPWHAIFYSGFISTAATIACIARKRATDAAIRTWFPPGYGLAALGIGVFAILSTPVRAAWLDPRPRRGWRQLGTAVISVAITTALIAFFLEYAFGITETWPQQQPFDDSNSDDERVVGLALATGYAATTVLVAPVLIFLRRRNAPMGAVVVIWVVPVLLETLAFDEQLIALRAVVAGGVAFDWSPASRSAAWVDVRRSFSPHRSRSRCCGRPGWHRSTSTARFAGHPNSGRVRT